MYTGPEFLLEVRLAQFMALLTFTFTFSAGLPVLYPLALISIITAYWVDKTLLLRFFRISPHFPKQMTRHVLNHLPLPIVLHLVFGYLFYSNGRILSSQQSQQVYLFFESADSQYFQGKRLGQLHIVIFALGSFLILLFLLFEKEVVYVAGLVGKVPSLLYQCMCSRCKKQEEGKVKMYVDEDQKRFKTASDDIFLQISYGQLFDQYVRYIKERQLYKYLKASGKLSAVGYKKHVEKYMEILERNKNSVYNRLSDLAEVYIHMDENAEPELMTTDQKIKAVNQYFNFASDKDNPLRFAMELDRALLGQILNQISSYDFMDNPKYKQINKLLIVLNETFGYSEDLYGLIRTSITDGYKALSRKQVELRKMNEDELSEREMPEEQEDDNQIHERDSRFAGTMHSGMSMNSRANLGHNQSTQQ
mmetsp:Transcript_1146/g.2101  ORF Transcript_1146/g.2101 Transcript_1146/m.2101 type:complete len:420 (+) Transcript_1146:3595-4854(+)